MTNTMHDAIRERIKPIDDARWRRAANARAPFSDYDLNHGRETGGSLRPAAVLVPLVAAFGVGEQVLTARQIAK